MKVYIVIHHWRGEGDYILGVFHNIEDAYKCKNNFEYSKDVDVQEFDVL